MQGSPSIPIAPRRTSSRSTSRRCAKEDAIALLAEQGVGLSATIHPTVLRAVTHLDVTDEDIDGALEAIPRALGARVGA